MCIVFLADIVLGLGFQVLFHQIPFCEFSDKERTPKNVDSIFVQSVGKYKQTKNMRQYKHDEPLLSLIRSSRSTASFWKRSISDIVTCKQQHVAALQNERSSHSGYWCGHL